MNIVRNHIKINCTIFQQGWLQKVCIPFRDKVYTKVYAFTAAKVQYFCADKSMYFTVRFVLLGTVIMLSGGVTVTEIDFNNINDEIVYEIFQVSGKESEALSDSYLELFEIVGRDAMLKLFKHYHGDKIECPMRLYRAEFIADLAEKEASRHDRAKIARAGGYSATVIERLLSKRRKENEID